MKAHLVGIIKETTPEIVSKPLPIKWIVGMISLLLGGYLLYTNRRKAIPLILASNAMGCASASIPMVFRPEGFTQDEIQQIKDDAEDWNTKSNGKYFVIIDENAPSDASVIRKVQTISGNAAASGECIAHVDVMGIRAKDSCLTKHDIEQYEINVADKPNFPVKCTVLHELGHVFGKQDNSIPDSVMSENTVICELSEGDVQ